MLVRVQVVRRQSLHRRSTLSSLLFGEDEADALKSKNIKQTELVAALREAITRTAEHFHCLDPHHSSTVSSPGHWSQGYRGHVQQLHLDLLCMTQDLTPDYSMESHQRDHENFLVVSRNRRRRAKALLDFERHDDDELGFRKNDIITVSLRPSINLLSGFQACPQRHRSCLTVFRSSRRRTSAAGWESSTASEVPSLIFPLLRCFPLALSSHRTLCCVCFIFFLKVGFRQSLWRSWMKEAKRYESNQPSACHSRFPVFWWVTEFSDLLPVLVSRRRFCDGGRHRSSQGHAVSSLEGHISAWPQKALHSRRTLSSVVVYRRGKQLITAKSSSFNALMVPLVLSQAASREVERDFNSVYSRLVLCKTYRYD